MSGEPPPIAELLPQAGPMRLLERVLFHDGAETRCEGYASAAVLFRDAQGRVPGWVAIEYMAQCAAADGSLRRRARGEPLTAGLFVGSRRIAFHCDGFVTGQRLVVSARHAAGRTGLVAYDCAVHDAEGGPPLAEGRLNLLPMPPSAAAARRRSGRST